MTLLWAIILFGILIFFHELGHFIFAKFSGVGISKFSLGFGPPLLKKKVGETDYMLSVIPLGGYVKMIGEEPGEELKEEDKARAFSCQPVWKRAVIVFAGPLFNFVLAYIIFVVFLSLNFPVSIPDLDNLTSTTIEDIAEDSPAKKAGLKENDKVISINGKTISTWVEMDEMFLKSPGKELNLKVKRGNDLIDISITPEPMEIKSKGGEGILVGKVGISKRTTTVIGDVLENSPAKRAGLKRNDSIVSIDGSHVKDWNEMAEILSKSPGKELNLKVKRGDDLIDFKVTPEPTKIKDEKSEENIVGRIGISGKLPFYLIQSSGILQAPLKGAEAVYEWSVLTLKVVGKILTGGVSAKQVGGPILIVDAASKAASTGAFAYFSFIALISINLAILNLLPIPVLDGGHLMFMSIEALRGKPLSERMMAFATKVGFTLIMLLIIFVFYNDTIRIIVPWFQKTFNP